VASQILAAVEDLFFLVQIQDAAKRAGCSIEFVRETSRIRDGAGTQLAIVDLSASALDPLAMIEAAKSAGIEVLAFVPHVQIELKQQALQAGADQVVARSNFAQHLRNALNHLLEKSGTAR
jgi:CheY-like chemotaxis protein